MHDLEPAYNPVMEAREKGLKRLRDRVKRPFKFQKEYDAAFAKAEAIREASEAMDRLAIEEREAARRSTLGAASENKPMFPAAWMGVGARVRPPRIPAPGSQKNPGNDGRPVSSGEALFADIDRINGAVRASVGTRLTAQAEHHSYDNSRVGVGPGGVHPGSGLFATDVERFSTTSLAYHAPLVFEPNKPVARPGGKCNADEDAEARARRRDARFARATRNLEATKERLAQDGLLQAMNTDQRERTTSETAYGYLQKAYFKDLRLHAREPLEVMAKKPNWPLFARTYTTSANTQLRDMTHLPDSRDMGTVHKKDLFQGRFDQTSYENAGSVLPDLHRTSMKGRW